MNTKKTILFCVFAYGISWLVALLMYLLKVPYDSFTSTVLIAVLYMPGPAFATLIVQKLIYKGSLKPYGLVWKNISAKWLLLTPLIMLGLSLLSLAVVAIGGKAVPEFGELIFSNDFIISKIGEMTPGEVNMDDINLPSSPELLFIIILFSSVIAGFSANLPFALGEELGWRGLLTEETRMLGFWKSNLLIGVIWGLWHAPIVMMGHNYPSYPYLGVLMMMAFTLSLSFILAYVRYKSGTVFAPAVFHGMLNATAGIYLLFIANGHELWSSIAGIAGIIAGFLITLIIAVTDREFISNYAVTGKQEMYRKA